MNFKIPEEALRLPTEEESRKHAAAWWSELAPFSLDAWPKALWAESINAIRIPLSMDIVNGILEERLSTDALADMLHEALVIHGELMFGGDTAEFAYNRWADQSGFFPRLSSRSPKDFLMGPSGSMDPCMTMWDVARALQGSVRVFDDLTMMRFLDTRNLYLRPYTKIDPSHEWRMFILEGKVTAISQYNYTQPLPSKRVSVQYFSKVMQAAREYAKLALNFLPTKDLVVDFVVRGDMRKILLETNPFGLSDPCVAHDYETIAEGAGELWFLDQHMNPISLRP